MTNYDIEFKKQVVKYYYGNGLTATANKFNLPCNETIYRWVRKYETVGLMRKKSKKLKAEEKLEILQYYWDNGPTETDIKYQINAGTIQVWNKIYEEHGLEGLRYDGRSRIKVAGKNFDELTDQEKLEYLLIENEYLKKLDALVTKREERERKKK